MVSAIGSQCVCLSELILAPWRATTVSNYWTAHLLARKHRSGKLSRYVDGVANKTLWPLEQASIKVVDSWNLLNGDVKKYFRHLYAVKSMIRSGSHSNSGLATCQIWSRWSYRPRTASCTPHHPRSQGSKHRWVVSFKVVWNTRNTRNIWFILTQQKFGSFENWWYTRSPMCLLSWAPEKSAWMVDPRPWMVIWGLQFHYRRTIPGLGNSQNSKLLQIVFWRAIRGLADVKPTHLLRQNCWALG